ncbi:SDR family oxidoreductase [Paeniglutamicibacter cryotolerans]|uniref:Nucleoside-diphosphate-sugar epimerase n=1 Tax=Paeniglutamicibacter cryotolerans TaxID=670079 RepID=A0A839QMX7_9MICC|nr:SDR family oxidoreductase [Paeniglutamicibacter cryotolerans]MBB2997257.1 nucleoside-diphosphate-sugar epimerase [Paeniglutamicibacter cryotolerans]
MAVVIAGCGDLGTETGLRFDSLGHRVIGLRRSAEKLPAEIEGRSIDLSTEVPTLPADTTIVVIAMSPDERSVDGYRAAYVESVLRIVTAIRQDCAAPPRVLYVSSTAVYGIDDGSWVDETTPAEPAAPTALVLREAEETLLELIPQATILRLGGLYGPGRTREIDRVRQRIASISPEPEFTSRIHRDDAAAAIVHLTTMQSRPKTVYIGVDDLPVDRREVVEFLARSLDLPAPEVADGFPHRQGSRGKRCRNNRLRDSGFVFSYPTYQEGYAAVLEGNGVRHA